MVIWTLFSDGASTIKQAGICFSVHRFVLKAQEGDLQCAGKCSWCSKTTPCCIGVCSVMLLEFLKMSKTHQQINGLIVS